MIERPSRPQDEDMGEDDAGSPAREGGRVAVGQREDFNAPQVETQESRVRDPRPAFGPSSRLN